MIYHMSYDINYLRKEIFDNLRKPQDVGAENVTDALKKIDEAIKAGATSMLIGPCDKRDDAGNCLGH